MEEKDPKVSNPIPLYFTLWPALRADVSRTGPEGNTREIKRYAHSIFSKTRARAAAPAATVRPRITANISNSITPG